MNRRDAIVAITAITAGGVLVAQRNPEARQTAPPFTVRGNGPALLLLERPPSGFFDKLMDTYRVVSIDYPPNDTSQAFIDGFTADKVCSDLLAAADAAGVDRFAWYGFSWGAVVGLQLATRTNRLNALAIGGFPPLGGQYEDTLAFTNIEAAQGRSRQYQTFYKSIRDWPEREMVSRLTMPRMVFVGANDGFVADGYKIRAAEIIAERREELVQMGWQVQIVEGVAHDLGFKADIVAPMVKTFLDSALRAATRS